MSSTTARKLRLGLTVSALMLGVLQAGQAQAQVAAAGTLKVAMEVSYPPFESYEGDKIVGFDPELSTLLAREMKLKPVFADTKFASLILGLGGGQHDTVISGLYVTAERTAIADAIPYASTGALIMVAKDGGVMPKTENDLCGLKVGLQAGTSWVKKLATLSSEYCVPKGKPPVTVSEFPTAPEVSQALMSKNVQAQLEVAAAAKAFSAKSNGRIVVSSPEPVYLQTLGVYVKKGNTALFKQFESAMAAIRKTGEYDALIKKYDLTPVAAK
jgi:polar amino acid transport system substrate-binding protein